MQARAQLGGGSGINEDVSDYVGVENGDLDALEQGHWHLVDAHLSQAGLLDRLATAVELHKPEGGGES